MIEVGNQKITKSDFIRVSDELDHADKAEFYLFIKNTPKLNAFLTSGDIAFFTNYKQENIYSDADFINFISPYFAEQFRKNLLQAYNNNNISLLKNMVANPPLVSSQNINFAYKSVGQLLESIENELHEVWTEINNKESYYNEETIGEIIPYLEEKAKSQLINALPQYFQSERNKIAQKVINIAVVVFNSINNVNVAFSIAQYALEFDSSDLTITKQKIQQDYKQIKKNYESRKESDVYAAQFQKYTSVFLQISQLIEQVENNQIQHPAVISKINSLFSATELNEQPNIFDEIREQIAMRIRTLSYAVLDKKNGIASAIELISVTQKINFRIEIKSRINSELNDLRESQIKPIMDRLKSMNVQLYHNETLNIGRTCEMLNNLFQSSIIQAISKTSSNTKVQIVNELSTILAELPPSFVNSFIDKISVLGSDDNSILNRINGMRKKQQPPPPDKTWMWWIVGVSGVVFLLICIGQCCK